MADVNKSIEISYKANIGALERALKRIPGITETQMKKAINEVEKELKQAERAATKTSKTFKQKFSNMGKSASMAGAAIGAAGFAMVEFGQRVADATNDLVDTSTKTGIAAETLQGLKIAAEGSGLAFEQFIGPLQRLQLLISEANKENKTATKLFDDMGVQVKDTNGELKDVDTVFKDMMETLGDMESPMERNSLLMRTFGKSGAMFAQSGVVGAMDEFVALGREFGLDVGPEAVKQAADFQRAMADLSTVGSGAMQEILSTITGKNGLGASIDALAEGVIYLKAAFVAAFSAISLPITVVNSKLITLQHLLMGDFDKAGAALAEGAVQAAKNWDDATSAFSRATKQIEELGKARAKIRNQNDSDEKQQDKNEKKKEERREKEIKQIKQIIELRKDDMDVFGNIIDARNKLFQMSKELYEGELDGEEKLKRAHQDRLENIGDLFLAEVEGINARADELRKALSDGQISEEEYYNRRVAMVNDLKDLHESANETRFQSEKRLQRDLVAMEEEAINEAAEIRMESIQSYFNDVQNLAGEITSVFINLQDQNVDHFVRNRDEAIDNIDKMEKAGVLSAQESTQQREDIEKAYQKTIQNQMMKAFRMKQAASVAAIIMDMAQASARAFADYPFPASVGIAALSAGKAGLELAAVQSQPPPKFDVGGMVGQSDPLAPDQTQAQLLTGEAVLDRSTVQRLGGEQGLRDLQNAPQSNVVVIQPFKHFDRFISASEKRGRFGTKRASSRY